MTRARPESSPIPDQVIDVLKTNKIGYLSVLSKKEDLYSYPVAYYYSGSRVYFMTPIAAAKFKILKSNPTVSFIVDNGRVTTEACGAMIQGKAKILTIGRTLMSILSVGPRIVGFTRKYPGMLTFYARGKELPDERKLYKYRLIKIDPSKIIYWVGYSFGRYFPEPSEKVDRELAELSQDESGLDLAARLLLSADGDVPVEPTRLDHDWLAKLDQTVSDGTLSEDEQKIMAAYRAGTSSKVSTSIMRGVTAEERMLLKKSKRS